MKKVALPLLLITAAVVAASLAFAADAAPPAADAKPAAPAKTAKVTAGTTDKAIAAIDAQIAAAKVNKSAVGWKQNLPKPTKVEFVKGHTYLWRMVTNKGTMVFKFKPEAAPMHVTSFIYLTRMGFFDGLKFHRVIKGFMAQGGDPVGTGGGSPGYKYDGEVTPAVTHDHRGILSTANAGPNTDGSQFFIMFKSASFLDGKYSIFGDLIEGAPGCPFADGQVEALRVSRAPRVAGEFGCARQIVATDRLHQALVDAVAVARDQGVLAVFAEIGVGRRDSGQTGA